MARHRIPNLFIVGAAKSGTNSLYDCLGKHPDIYVSPLKEPHYFAQDLRFFASDSAAERSVLDWDEYLGLFKDASREVIIAEASNSYLYSRVAARLIQEMVPDAKILVMLRNPLESVVSWYVHHLHRGNVHRTLRLELLFDSDAEVPWGAPGMYRRLFSYSQQLLRYFELFPASQIKVILSEDLWQRSEETISSIFRFLGLSGGPSAPMGRLNAGAVPRWPLLNYSLQQLGIREPLARLLPEFLPDALKRSLKLTFFAKRRPALSQSELVSLKGLFCEEIERTQQLIKRDLSGWLQ